MKLKHRPQSRPELRLSAGSPPLQASSQPGAGAQLDAALATDQAERSRIREKWRRRLKRVRGWRDLYDSRELLRIAIGGLAVMGFVWAVARWQAFTDLNPKLITVTWCLLYLGVRLGTRWFLRVVENLVIHLASREGVEVSGLGPD